MELWKFFLQIGYVGKTVLLILFFMSLQSWYIIIANFFRYKNFQDALEEINEKINKTKDFPSLIKLVRNMENNLLVRSIKKIITFFGEIYEYYFENEKTSHALDMDLTINLAEKELMQKSLIEKEQVLSQIDKGLGFLATVGNVAPFIGLFGTVWGIMKAFHDIGMKGSASLATVAPGIAEALINTAMGLFCAIPAVIAYNYYLLKKEKIATNLELTIKKIFLILQRGFISNLK